MAEEVRSVARARRARVAGYGALVLVAVVVAVTVALTLMPARRAAVIEAAPVPGEMRTCRADAECGLVETTCSSCCGTVGINRAFEQAYYARVYAPACDGYDGAVCDCIIPRVVPVCRQGLCELIEPPGNGGG
jgi:hypothetical protein